jgi:carbamoyltransferase
MLEHAHDWFDMAGLKESPFMMFAVDVLEEKQKLIPCVTHVDGTCRIQTVTKEQNI